MKKRTLVVLVVVCICALVAFGQNGNKKKKPEAASSPSPTAGPGWQDFESVKFQNGPATGDLGTTAKVKVPDGFVFANGADTRTIMEAMQNTTNGQELGFLAPAGEPWYVVFEFSPEGYVKDDEKDALDSDAILQSIKDATARGNTERIRRGWPTLTITGWQTPPHYNEVTHNLEWAVKLESEGQSGVNHNTRLLGRGGVMAVTLVTDPAKLNEVLPKFNTLVSGFDFVQGQRYSEFRPGDKMAAYGLTGLIAGGGVAVAAKSGLLKWLWKGIVAAVVGISALFKKIFSRGGEKAV